MMLRALRVKKTTGTSYLRRIKRPHSYLTTFGGGMAFPELLPAMLRKYEDAIHEFAQLVEKSDSCTVLLGAVRNRPMPIRGALLKIYRRTVCPMLDIEDAKKVKIVSTDSLLARYKKSSKDISLLKEEFRYMSCSKIAALCVLLGEYDKRGQSGYALTDAFFSWFEDVFGSSMTIEGPRGAGPDIQLRTVFPAFTSDFPCDFVIRCKADGRVLAIGLAHYVSSRGGGQTYDRFGNNGEKVSLAREFASQSGQRFRFLFLADGRGLAHKDAWNKACELDGKWPGNVRVSTLLLAPKRVTEEWLRGT